MGGERGRGGGVVRDMGAAQGEEWRVTWKDRGAGDWRGWGRWGGFGGDGARGGGWGVGE